MTRNPTTAPMPVTVPPVNHSKHLTAPTMRRALSAIPFVVFVAALVSSQLHAQPNHSSLVFPGADGRLLYRPDAWGNRIPDFSTVGYRRGNELIPDVSAVLELDRTVTVAPGQGDDTDRIQSVIDQVARMPTDASGFRGVVQLESGEFQIGGQLHLRRSGIVLRGMGHGTDPARDTILRGTGLEQRELVVVGSTAATVSNVRNSTHQLIDKYVPVGATSFRVDSTENWSVGDLIRIQRPSTREWIDDLGMNRIPPRRDGRAITQWTAGSRDQHYERFITRIEGDRVFVDAPFVNSIEQQYGGATATRVRSRRMENVGVENLSGVSDYASDTDEDHAWTFIKFEGAENAWARDITAKHFGFAAVHVGRNASQITVQNIASLEPKSVITGARRYAFNIEGQRTLMMDLVSEEGRHDFVNNSPSRGPNVFLNGQATRAHSEAGPHQRWSTGTLYDNITVSGDSLAAWNRGNFGSGHGWSGANMVFWNSRADTFRVQNPPTAQNWVIGGVGRRENPSDFLSSEAGIYDSHGLRVSLGDPVSNPTDSLYVAQLNERLADPSADRRGYLLGDYDLMTHDMDSVDDPSVDDAWLEALRASPQGQGASFVGFDHSAGQERVVPFSFEFEIEDDRRVDRGVLTVAMRGPSELAQDNWIVIDNSDDRRPLSDLMYFEGPIATADPGVLILEFLGNELEHLADGQLNLAIGGMGVDWAHLEVTTTAMPVPEPNPIGLWAVVLVVGLSMRRSHAITR